MKNRFLITRIEFFGNPRSPSVGGSPTVARRSTATMFFALTLGLLWTAGPCSLAQTAAPAAPEVQTLPKVTLHVGKATLNTEIAATGPQRERGLMFRSRMADNDGMIFLMPNIATATFWMKNTLIPLSIAFIDKNGVILDIHDMKALDESIVRSDTNQVAFALETNLHWFALNGVKPGDKIDPAPATLGKPTL